MASAGPRERGRTKVLIVEDEAIIALDLERRLRRLGCDVVGTADHRDEAVALFQQHQPDLVLMDVFIRPPVDGIETARTLTSMRDVPVIFLTAYADDETLRRAAQTKPYGYLLKPFDERTLAATVTIGLERHQTDQRLRLLQTAVECSTLGVALASVTGPVPEIINCNDAYARLHRSSWEALVGTLPRSPPTGDAEDETWMASALKSKSEQHRTLHWTDEDGCARWSSVRVSPVPDRSGAVTHVIVFCEDTSRERMTMEHLRVREIEYAELETVKEELRLRAEELAVSVERLKSTQEELVRREKLASLGVLVAGIAHEIRTPLGVALTASSLARSSLSDVRRRILAPSVRRSEAVRELDSVDEAWQITEANLTRAARLLRQFNAVAVHQGNDEVQTFCLVGLARDVVASLGPLMRKSRLRVVVDGDASVRVETLPGTVSQVITNFVTNAALHAYAPQEDGVLSLSLRADGDEAVLIAQDVGRGMTAEVARRAFDPFFTTRLGSGGSGLGLFVVHNLVVEGLRGTITLDSSPGAGARFEVRIPRVLERPPPGANGDD